MSELSFEQQVLRLEEIVAALDRGDVPIDDLLTLYAEGMKLVQECRTYLEEAEQKVIAIDRQGTLLSEDDF